MNAWEAFLEAARRRGESEQDIARKSQWAIAEGWHMRLKMFEIPSGLEEAQIQDFMDRQAYYRKLKDTNPAEHARRLEENKKRCLDLQKEN